MSLALSRMLMDGLFPYTGRPPMDWKETPEAHVFRMDVPGLSKEQVAVELVDGRILRVRGGGGGKQDAAAAAKDGNVDVDHDHEEREEEEDGAVRWHCRERASTRAFETKFRLPEDAAADEVRAAMADGVLTVTVPKRNKGGKKRHHHGPGGDKKTVCCRFWP